MTPWQRLGLCLYLGFLVHSCTPAMDASAPTTILVFAHGTLSGNPVAYSNILRDFERRQPGVVVREEVLPASTDQQHQFYAINLEGEPVPFDLLAVDTIWVQEFARAGWIADVDALLSPTDRDRYFSGPIGAATFNGRLYAIPWYIDAGVLYYRRDLLDRYGFPPPLTWPELVRVARDVQEAERDPDLRGFIWQGKQYEGLVCVALEFIRSNGSDLWTGDERRAAVALESMRSLLAPEGLTPLSVATADEEATRHLFGSGRAIFLRNWPYAWSLFQQEGSPVRGRVGLAPLPSFPGSPSVPTLGGWMLAIPGRSSHPREAGELVQYLTSPEVQRRMALELGYKPVRRDLYQDKALLAMQPWLRELLPVFLAARPRPVSPYYLMMSQVAQPELSAVVVGTKTGAAAVAAVRKQTAQLLARHERFTSARAF
jgi:multiple sugar transport system substrate-binding protein